LVHTATDDDILEQCLSFRDRKAWEVFVRAFSPVVWAAIHKTLYLYAFPHDDDDLEDIYETLFLSLLEKDCRKLRLFQKRNACSLTTWLTIITVRTTVDYMRKQKRYLRPVAEREGEAVEDAIPDISGLAGDVLEKREEADMFLSALETLPARDRMIYELLYTRNASPEEAAEIMGLSVSGIYSRKSRIIGKIKKYVRQVQENGSSAV
jgi:RNA polymerase sigma factor (sigma-70 family)